MKVFYYSLFTLVLVGVFIVLKKEDFSKCRVASLRLDNFKVELDVASDDIKRKIGLMFVKNLSKDKGMIFVFDKEEEHLFWMKNTYIPLDIIFVSKDFKINKISTLRASFFEENEKNVPRVSGIGKYVIELNAGFTKEFGLTEGKKIDLICLKK